MFFYFLEVNRGIVSVGRELGLYLVYGGGGRDGRGVVSVFF